ncbi:MAG: maleylacetoacetate isomerase [Gammaproteobacteria bacterium]|nr:maleylacetoacetate isomerase [Gammaproteobacteria bacterium]
MIRLHSYWRSTAAYRVRIALNLKNLDYELMPVHLVRDGGEQHKPAFRGLNPQGRVPLLEHDGTRISQSLAIVEYLDEVFKEPPLLPDDAHGRARVRSLAQLVACDIHPLNNLSVLAYLKGEFGADKDQVGEWYGHWIEQGFTALEQRLNSEDAGGEFCHGARPGIADLCLVPQVYNARRFNIDIGSYHRILEIDSACMALPAFQRAAPERQPDAE